jgi:endoplasmic reticulum chaperone BiP
VISIDVP